MKLTRFRKQIIAVVCSIALVIAGFAFAPAKSAKADGDLPDWGTLNWTTVDGMFTDFAYCIVENNMTGFARMNCYGVNYMQAVGSGDTKFNESTLTVVDSTNTDVTSRLTWSDKAAAIYGVMVSQLGTTDQYYLFTYHNDTTGTAKVAVRVGNPSGGETSSEESTSPGETTTKAPTVLPDFDNLEWTTVDNMFTDVAYSVVKSDTTGFARMNFYGTNYMQAIGSGDSKFNESTLEVLDKDANDVTSRMTWSDKAAAIYGLMLSQIGTTDNYYLFTYANDTTGDLQVAIRIGNPGGGETSSHAPQKPLAPTGLTWAGNDNLPYYFAWGASATSGIDHYNFYVGDTVIGTSNGAAYNADGYFASAAPGQYNLKVTAVKDDLESDPATLTWTKPYPAGWYDVTDYKAQGTYPSKDGMIFAGWFTDDTCTTAYTESTGYAYAKFIDEDVLTVKFQKANDGSAVRFLSSVDGMQYSQVGFTFTGAYGNATITEKTKTTNSLYTKITAAGESILPTVFSPDSAYFFTYTVRGMDANTESSWNVTPFFVTLDGTTVTGTAGTYPQA